jgi:hypothetical protein
MIAGFIVDVSEEQLFQASWTVLIGMMMQSCAVGKLSVAPTGLLDVSGPSLATAGYIGARNDTTQESGQTPDKKVQIKNITVYVSGYTETDTTGMLSPPTVWRQQ